MNQAELEIDGMDKVESAGYVFIRGKTETTEKAAAELRKIFNKVNHGGIRERMQLAMLASDQLAAFGLVVTDVHVTKSAQLIELESNPQTKYLEADAWPAVYDKDGGNILNVGYYGCELRWRRFDE